MTEQIPNQSPETIPVDEVERLVAFDADWVMDPWGRRLRRLDNGYFDVRWIDRGTYGQFGLYEEPTIPQPASGGPRIVGRIIVRINPRGLVEITKKRGLDGEEFLQLPMSSLSNPDAVAPPAGGVWVGVVKTNPQRILGDIEVYVVNEEFPDQHGLIVDRFKRECSDTRSLAALVKAGL